MILAEKCFLITSYWSLLESILGRTNVPKVAVAMLLKYAKLGSLPYNLGKVLLYTITLICNWIDRNVRVTSNDLNSFRNRSSYNFFSYGGVVGSGNHVGYNEHLQKIKMWNNCKWGLTIELGFEFCTSVFRLATFSCWQSSGFPDSSLHGSGSKNRLTLSKHSSRRASGACELKTNLTFCEGFSQWMHHSFRSCSWSF